MRQDGRKEVVSTKGKDNKGGDLMKTKRLLNVEEISEYLGVKVATIYGWVSEGYIPHIKLGRLVRFDLDAVTEWVKQKEVQGRSSRMLEKDFLYRVRG